MLMYVIPLIILIVVLIVIKKRQDAQGSDQPPKKGSANSKAKKTSSTRTQKKPSKIVEADVVAVEAKKAQPISDETRKRIESLIKDRNFFAAEAQINQALKRDNSQHALYLLLLDVHLLQKDEFAVKQLISHITALELHDIVEQAQVKVANEKASTQATETIQFSSNPKESTESDTNVATPDNLSNDAFDALMTASTPKAHKPEPTIEDTLLEFTTSPIADTQEVTKPVIETESTALEFTPSFATQVEPTKENTNIEVDSTFSTQDTPSKPVQNEPATDEIKPLDFSFSLSSSEVATEEKPIETAEVIIQEEPLKANEFILDFATNDNDTKKSERLSTDADEVPSFDLSFNTEKTPATESNLTTSFVEDIAPASTEEESKTSDLDVNDPLVEAFPALLDVNEIELNLDLAQKYIELGVYDAARAILAENESEYSPEQRQIADQLLNQIAS